MFSVMAWIDLIWCLYKFDFIWSIFFRFTKALYRFCYQHWGHLSDKELQMRLEIIGKQVIGLLTLHFRFPILSLQWLMRSAVNTDVQSGWELGCQKGFDNHNQSEYWHYIKFLIQRRALQGLPRYPKGWAYWEVRRNLIKWINIILYG